MLIQCLRKISPDPYVPNATDTQDFNRYSYARNNPFEYRAGVLYIGWGPIVIGRNSEKIRHAFQNRFAHDFLMKGESAHFLRLDQELPNKKRRKPKWYWGISMGSGNTLW